MFGLILFASSRIEGVKHHSCAHPLFAESAPAPRTGICHDRLPPPPPPCLCPLLTFCGQLHLVFVFLFPSLFLPISLPSLSMFLSCLYFSPLPLTPSLSLSFHPSFIQGPRGPLPVRTVESRHAAQHARHRWGGVRPQHPLGGGGVRHAERGVARARRAQDFQNAEGACLALCVIGGRGGAVRYGVKDFGRLSRCLVVFPVGTHVFSTVVITLSPPSSNE